MFDQHKINRRVVKTRLFTNVSFHCLLVLLLLLLLSAPGDIYSLVSDRVCTVCSPGSRCVCFIRLRRNPPEPIKYNRRVNNAGVNRLLIKRSFRSTCNRFISLA